MLVKFEKSQLVFLALSIALAQAGWRWYQSLERAGNHVTDVPSFASFDDVSKRKQRFIEYLFPLITDASLDVLKDRKLLIDLEQHLSDGGGLSREQLMTLEKLALRYATEYDSSRLRDTIRHLLARVDIVPASLILAQAAHETAWGTSRFATEANNFFGQWCYREGCGLVPGTRDEGETHEVRVFSYPAESVNAYLLNINRNRAYSELRRLRLQLRHKKQPVTGYELASGLSKYSERGESYIKSIRGLIKSNQLQKYTQQFNSHLDEYPDLQDVAPASGVSNQTAQAGQ